MTERTIGPEWGWDATGPVWGTRVFAPKTGQDHLGLGSVSSDRILAQLSPGINVLTIHPRYWSFYAWVLDDFWATDLPRTRAAFRDFYRPREAIFSMACHVCDAPGHPNPFPNVVGNRRISPLVSSSSFDPQFDYIKEALGGYSLYYRSTMEMMGAIVLAGPDTGFPFDAPTPVGRALAEAFRSAVSGTAVAGQLSRGDVTTPIGRQSLAEFARKACLCQLRDADTTDLPLLQDMFLHAGGIGESLSRSESLRLLLDLSACTPDSPIGQDEFRQLVYFRELDDSTFDPRGDLVDVARRWRVYQAREYFSYAFNRLLRWVSRRGLLATDGGLVSLSAADLWRTVDEALDQGGESPLWRSVTSSIEAKTPATELYAHVVSELDAAATTGDDVWRRHYILDEHKLYVMCRDRDEDDGETLVALLVLILLLRARFGVPQRWGEYPGEQGLLEEGGTARIGMGRFMRFLNRQLMRGASCGALLKWLIEDFVIVQHERVAASKLPDDTYRVRRVGDSIRFFAQEVPAAFNDSRFIALSTSVHELGFVSSFREPNRTLTAAGTTLLAEGDLKPGALSAAAAPFDTGNIDA